MPEGLDTLDPTDGVILFTDGSASTRDKSGGWAWVAFDLVDGEAWDSGGERDTTNNQMEMLAWIEGLSSLYQEFGPLLAIVYSDSQYVGYGAMDRTRKRNKNHEYWEWIDNCVDAHTAVEFVHVRGHVGYIYNERVDRLASKARKAIL